MTEETLDDIAQSVADCLFLLDDKTKQPATRLELKRIRDGHEIGYGGWCRHAVVSAVRMKIRAHVKVGGKSAKKCGGKNK